MDKNISFGKAVEWQSCTKRWPGEDSACQPAGKAKEVGTDGKLYRQCQRCGRWVPEE